MPKGTYIPPTNARLRPVFFHSRKESETPQPGIQQQSISPTTSPVVSPPTAHTVDGGNLLRHSASQSKTHITPPISNEKSSNNSNSSEPSAKKIVKVGSVFTKPNSKPSLTSAINELSPLPPTPSSENIVIDKFALITAWKKIKEEKNLFDNASIMRIISVEPTLIDDNHFEIYVANPNAESFFQTNRNEILKALSANLNNKKLEMIIRVVQDSGSQKILNPLEQIKEMLSQNPSFGKLKENLDLSI